MTPGVVANSSLLANSCAKAMTARLTAHVACQRENVLKLRRESGVSPAQVFTHWHQSEDLGASLSVLPVMSMSLARMSSKLVSPQGTGALKGCQAPFTSRLQHEPSATKLAYHLRS
jgi:hypothetical protein